MKYNMKKPCDNCPFRRGTSIRLRQNRARQIGEMMLSPDGGTFSCHKTTYLDDDGDDVDCAPRSKDTHCLGALAFAEKNGNATQMMRIAERTGAYDARVAITFKDDVWNDVDEFIEGVKETKK